MARGRKFLCRQGLGVIQTGAVPYNTRLGLPFENSLGEGADADAVREMAETYSGEQVPDGAALVTAGVDVQAGWLAMSICAWGHGDECWPLQWHEVQGEARDPRTWDAVARLLEQTFRHPSGATLPIEAVAIDAGYETQAVYEFSQRHRARGKRWFSTKGMSGQGETLWTRGGRYHDARLARFFSRRRRSSARRKSCLGLARPRGRVRCILAADFPEHWWQWACSEEQVQRETAGGVKTEWRMKNGQRRNEVLDTLTLALAVAVFYLTSTFRARLHRLQHDRQHQGAATEYRRSCGAHGRCDGGLKGHTMLNRMKQALGLTETPQPTRRNLSTAVVPILRPGRGVPVDQSGPSMGYLDRTPDSSRPAIDAMPYLRSADEEIRLGHRPVAAAARHLFTQSGFLQFGVELNCSWIVGGHGLEPSIRC